MYNLSLSSGLAAVFHVLQSDGGTLESESSSASTLKDKFSSQVTEL